MSQNTVSNEQLADIFEEVAELLQRKDGNEHRARAYHIASSVIRGTEFSVSERLKKDGPRAITELRGIGKGIAASIEEINNTGKLSLLDHLQCEQSFMDTLKSLPGIGQKLAEEIHDKLGIESLEELEMAVHDGRVEQLSGMGKRRTEGLAETLNSILSRSKRRRMHEIEKQPSVPLLLEIDREYRQKADEGKLHTIAPRRFNPDHDAWLPIMNTQRDGWKFTAMYSNTHKAHEFGKTHEWVVIYYSHDSVEDQCTVVSYSRGSMKGKRVIRGREQESLK
ncbi:MAG: DNA-binding protein [Chitinivibrionales bacterium]|nr:DNA-binding protein [Chitinivibrionales bacterium]